MKVKELIAELEKFNPETEVFKYLSMMAMETLMLKMNLN